MQTEVDLKPGMRLELSIPAWLARDKGMASREMSGVVLRASAKAVFCALNAVIRESDACLACGREIDNPASRVLGYGPICSERLGLPHAETYAAMSPEERSAVLRAAEVQSTVECWLPLSQVVIRSATEPEPFVPGDEGLPLPPGLGEPVRAAPQPKTITWDGTEFVLGFGYDRDLVDAVKRIQGRKWDNAAKQWTVPLASAGELAVFAAEHGFELLDAAQERIAAAGELRERNLAESRAAAADFHVEGLGGTPYPFQRAGISYMARNRRVLLGDQPGLGKTVQYLALVEYLQAYPALVVVPSSLKLNWAREAARWIPGRTVSVLAGKKPHSLGRRPADLTIINYDILPSWVKTHEDPADAGKKRPRLIATGPLVDAGLKAIGFDEAHLVKNHRAQRTNALKALSGTLRAHHRAQAEPWEMVLVAMTGTPVLNRIPELISPLEIIDRMNDLGGWWHFARRYCGFEGVMGALPVEADALEELNQKMRAVCYVRRLKADVLKELPAKVRTTLPFPIDNAREYARAEQDLAGFVQQQVDEDRAFHASLSGLSKEDRARRIEERKQEVADKADRAEALVKLNVLKRLAAKGKMEAVTEWISSFLESGEKLVVGAWHQDVVEGIAAHFGAPYIHGGVSIEDRDKAVSRFQACGRCGHRQDAHDGAGACQAYQPDLSCPLIVLNTKSGGVGLTLTAASDLAVVEFPWTPGELDQLEDRIHRIGQQGSANIYYLVAEGTVDEDVCALIDAKRQVVDAATDGEGRTGSVSIMADLMKRLQARQQAVLA